MAIDMRTSKLTAEEASLLAGELKKPNWQSKNEGIHERVSFEDTIWGFDLAGGSYYNTPLRVVGVKKGSRAEKAGIRLGDKLKRINDIETSTLTIQEAHEIIIESGVHLKIAVTAPEDEEDAYFCYEDQIENGYDSDEERRRLEEKIKKRQIHAKVSSYWSLQWPWVSKRRVIYRESNCFMVPSKFENSHKDKFPSQPFLRVEDDIVLQKAKNAKELEEAGIPSDDKAENLANGDVNEGEKSVNNGNEENSAERKSEVESLINEKGINQDLEKYFTGNSKDMSELEENAGHSEREIKKEKEILDNEDEVSREEVSNDFQDETHKIKDTSDIDEEKDYDEETDNIKDTSDIDEEKSQDKVTTDSIENKANEIKEEPHFEEYVSQDEITDDLDDKTSTNNDGSSPMHNVDIIISQADDVIKSLADDGDLSTDDERLLDSILSDGADSRRNNSESER